MKQYSTPNMLDTDVYKFSIGMHCQMHLPDINTGGAGKINKAANIAAAAALLLVLILGIMTNLFASVTTFPAAYFYMAAVCAAFAVGFIAGGKLEFDRLFTLVSSLGWVAGGIISMCDKHPSAIVASGLCIAFGTAAGGRSLYNFLVLGGSIYTRLEIAMQDLQRARDKKSDRH